MTLIALVTTLALLASVVLALSAWRRRIERRRGIDRAVPREIAPQEIAPPAPVADVASPPEAAPPPDTAADPPEAPPDPVWLAALDMARTAHLIAQHLGFEAIPDRHEPSVRRLRIALRNELERRAAERLASTAELACVRRVELTPDARHAIALVDTAAPPPPP